MNDLVEESPYRLRVAGGDPVPVEVRRRELPPESFGSRFKNNLPPITIELRPQRKMLDYDFPANINGEPIRDESAQLAVFHDQVDGEPKLGGIVHGRVRLVDLSGPVFQWLPADEMAVLP